jgi:hypothetical protein
MLSQLLKAGLKDIKVQENWFLWGMRTEKKLLVILKSLMTIVKLKAKINEKRFCYFGEAKIVGTFLAHFWHNSGTLSHK